jgi:hypothetical protein
MPFLDKHEIRVPNIKSPSELTFQVQSKHSWASVRAGFYWFLSLAISGDNEHKKMLIPNWGHCLASGSCSHVIWIPDTRAESQS